MARIYLFLKKLCFGPWNKNLSRATLARSQGIKAWLGQRKASQKCARFNFKNCVCPRGEFNKYKLNTWVLLFLKHLNFRFGYLFCCERLLCHGIHSVPRLFLKFRSWYLFGARFFIKEKKWNGNAFGWVALEVTRFFGNFMVFACVSPMFTNKNVNLRMLQSAFFFKVRLGKVLKSRLVGFKPTA